MIDRHPQREEGRPQSPMVRSANSPAARSSSMATRSSTSERPPRRARTKRVGALEANAAAATEEAQRADKVMLHPGSCLKAVHWETEGRRRVASSCEDSSRVLRGAAGSRVDARTPRAGERS